MLDVYSYHQFIFIAVHKQPLYSYLFYISILFTLWFYFITNSFKSKYISKSFYNNQINSQSWFQLIIASSTSSRSTLSHVSGNHPHSYFVPMTELCEILQQLLDHSPPYFLYGKLNTLGNILYSFYCLTLWLSEGGKRSYTRNRKFVRKPPRLPYPVVVLVIGFFSTLILVFTITSLAV